MNRPNHYLQIASIIHAGGSKLRRFVALRNKPVIHLASLLLLLLAGGLNAQTEPSTQPNPNDPKIASLIANLSSDDASVRQSAANDLITIGAPARPAVINAMHQNDPGVREQAAQIILVLPWSLPEDPENVRKLLSDYGKPEVAARRAIVQQLAELDIANAPTVPAPAPMPATPLTIPPPGPSKDLAPSATSDPASSPQSGQGATAPASALCRLVSQDPSPDVRWTIVGRIRERDQGPEMARFRAIEPYPDDAPMLALCGFAHLEFDQVKAIKYFQKCAEIEFASPNDDDGEFEYVIRALADLDCNQKKYEAAAELRRRQIARGSTVDDAGAQSALTELFVLHGDFGPLSGIDDDIKLAGKSIDSPKVQYALSRMYARGKNAKQAESARLAAWQASTARHQRFEVGEFLYDHGWDDLATPEYEEFLKMPPDPNEVLDPSADVNAHFRLAGLAVKRGDDFTAAQHKEQAIRWLGDDPSSLVKTDGSGHRWPATANEIWAEIHWRYMRAALARHDEPTAREQLGELLKLKPDDPEIAMDLVPLLKQRGQADIGQSIFDQAFASMKSKLDADPHNPALLNGLAWMCAKCDLKLSDALVWAGEASEAAPNNSAITDTLAEVNFHLGRPAEAARLEARALETAPNDTFMIGQLKRFQEAAQTRPSTQPQ
ncbi:MAG: hypothetical protein M3O30_05485 [Planctomycetota bacterium]|nr:hypothetical protein [Planctomycetota bacterium]